VISIVSEHKSLLHFQLYILGFISYEPEKVWRLMKPAMKEIMRVKKVAIRSKDLLPQTMLTSTSFAAEPMRQSGTHFGESRMADSELGCEAPVLPFGCGQ
jgi:hypothetical protein